MSDARAYRFADSNRPGLLLGLSARQAVPMIVGAVVLAVALQTPLHPLVGLIGPAVGSPGSHRADCDDGGLVTGASDAAIDDVAICIFAVVAGSRDDDDSVLNCNPAHGR